MQRRLAKELFNSALPLLLSACATSGIGVGYSHHDGVQANFAWHSNDNVHGTMKAVLINGDAYEGPYFQITRETEINSLTPLWFGWNGRSRWHGWDGWGPGISTATTYTPRVLANLARASGERMRCRFTLSRPAEGMAGGGLGRCQLPDGTVIYAEFPRS